MCDRLLCVVVAVVLLSVAPACAVVAIAVLARGRDARRATTTLALPGLAPLSAPQATAENSQAWETLFQPVDGGGVSRLSVAHLAGSVPAAGRHLPATAPFALALQELVRSHTGAGSSISTVSEGAGLLFRFDASPDLLSGLSRGLFEVMPAARGGFLSPVRQVGNRQVVGHGAYVCAGRWHSGRRGATAAAAPALAPVLLVAGITAALEFATAAEPRRQLEAITKITAAVREDQVREQIAGLEAAAPSLELAAGSIVDVGFVPKALGIDSAADTVGREWQRSSRKLQEWRDALTELGESSRYCRQVCGGVSRVHASGRRRVLAGAGDLPDDSCAAPARHIARGGRGCCAQP